MKKIYFILILLTIVLSGTAFAKEYASQVQCLQDVKYTTSNDFMFKVLNKDSTGAEDMSFGEYSNAICSKTTCKDSDEGLDPYARSEVKGTVFIDGVAYIYEFHDFCTDCNQNLVAEFYCEDVPGCGSVPRMKVIECDPDCQSICTGEGKLSILPVRSGAGEPSAVIVTEDNNEYTENTEVPEFSIIATGIAMIGAISAFLFIRKKK